MPRPSRLSDVPLDALQAEIERRVKKLEVLLKLRDHVDRQIAELKALAGQFVKAPAKRGRKAKAVARPVAGKKERKRSQYGQTATEFVLGLLAGGKVLTSAELTEAWTKAGRKGKVDNALTKLVKAKKLKRQKIWGRKGSKYRLA